jgi:hypothetical protein
VLIQSGWPAYSNRPAVFQTQRIDRANIVERRMPVTVEGQANGGGNQPHLTAATIFDNSAAARARWQAPGGTDAGIPSGQTRVLRDG